MKNQLFIIFLIGILSYSCKDSRIEAIREDYKTQTNSPLSEFKDVVIENHVALNNGTLIFKSKESFDVMTNFILSSKVGKEKFVDFLNKNGFKSLFAFYESFPEEKLLQFSKEQSIPDEFRSYYVITEEGGELSLERNVQSTFLRLYFNENMEFYINMDMLKMEGERLFIYSNGIKQELVSKTITNKNAKQLATGNYLQYSSGGKDYRLKVESDTRWGEVSLYHTPYGYQDFWNYIEYWAHHRRRPFGVWIAQDVDEIWVEGSHYWANPSSGNYEFATWSPGVLYSTNDASWYGNYVHSYTYTGHCKGMDGLYKEVTISETNN